MGKMESVSGMLEPEVCSWVEARDTLRNWREEDFRKSSRIVQLGRHLLKEKRSQLGGEGMW